MLSSSAAQQTVLSQLFVDERTLLTLQGRLLTLTDQTRWDGQHVQIAPRAFAEGSIVHTNDLRVHLGDGWWAEMTAKQAAAFVGRKLTALQAKIRLLQAEMIESTLPTNAETPTHPPGLSSPSSVPTVPTTTPTAPAPAPAPAPKLQTQPRPKTVAPSTTKPPSSKPEVSTPVAPTGQTRTLRDEAGKLMTDDLGFPIVEIVEPPSPTSSKRKAPPPISPVSRRTEKQRAEARKRAFEEAERDEKEETDKQARIASPSAQGQMKTLKDHDGKDLVDDQGLPMIEIVEPVGADVGSSTRSSSSVAPLPPARTAAERRSAVRQALEQAEAEETTLANASRASQTDDAPLVAPSSLANVEDPLKLVEELLSPDVAAAGAKDPVIPVNVLHEILSEDGLPISRIQEPLPADSTSRPPSSSTFDPTAPVPAATPIPLAPSAQTPANIKQSIFDKLEAEEKEMERRERLGLPPLEPEVVPVVDEDEDGEDTGWGETEEEILNDLTTPDKGKGKAKETISEPKPGQGKRKSVSWSEKDHVKEFKSTESPSTPSPAPVQADTQPAAENGAPSPSTKTATPAPSAGETMKFKVVERAPVPVKAGKVKMGGAKEGGKTGWVKPVVTDEAMAYLANLEAKKAAASAAPRPVVEDAPVPIARPTSASRSSAPSPSPSQPPTKQPVPSASVEEIESDHDAQDDDSGSNDSFQFSDDDDDENGGDGGGLSMDMDDNMQLREAAVEYYRLRGVLQGKGGLSGAAGGTGDLEDKSEFVPLNATVSQSLDSTTLSLPTGPLNSTSAASRFKSSILTPAESASMNLPTLIPGGGATGALAGAIRVGKLENGKLVVGRGTGPDGEELDDDDSGDEGEGEEAELSEAGKEALMWGMVGGVVVQEEDLDKGGEALLAKLTGGPAQSEVAAPPTRMDFYQADKTVTVSVYEKGLIPADVRVKFEARQVLIHLPTRSIALSSLSAPINATLSSFRVSPVKIELTLMKSQVGLRWNSITTGPLSPMPSTPLAESSVAPTTALPTSDALPAAPAKVSRFKARQAEIKGAPVAGSAPGPEAAEPAQTLPQLVSDPAERTAVSPNPTVPVKREQPPVVVAEEPVVAQEEEEKPKKRVSRFKAERMKA